MEMIKGRLKESQYRYKIYFNAHQMDRSYEVGDRVFWRVRAQMSSIRFGKGIKLSPQFVGPFEIIERKRKVAYRLVLPTPLVHMQDMFHVSILGHYILIPSHIIDLGHLHVSGKGMVMDELVRIMY